jgi:hypothetical protein
LSARDQPQNLGSRALGFSLSELNRLLELLVRHLHQDRLGGPRTAALLESMAQAALARYGAGWIDDRGKFARAERLWRDMLEAARPPLSGALMIREILAEVSVWASANGHKQLQEPLDALSQAVDQIGAAPPADPAPAAAAERAKEG